MVIRCAIIAACMLACTSRGSIGATEGARRGDALAQGFAGDEGPKGQNGAMGDEGRTGDMGAFGAAGVIGSQGDKGITGTNGAVGAPGVSPPGAPGVTGTSGLADLRDYLYGDAADGDLDLDGPSPIPVGVGKQYADCHVGVQAPTGFIVESGTVIRCAGTFTIDAGAMLRVAQFARGGSHTKSDGLREAHPGIGRSAAGEGARGDYTQNLRPTYLAFGLRGGINPIAPASIATGLLRFGLYGGGGGGTGIVTEGGSGGGVLRIFARLGININGTISANGSPADRSIEADGERFTDGSHGSGGGGGGVVLLVSNGPITITGFVLARGGTGSVGSDSSRDSASGGGGGGGIVHTFSPNALVGGSNIDVSGGAYGGTGITITTVTNTPPLLRGAGGGGGASCGFGGMGGGVAMSSSGVPASALDPSISYGYGIGGTGCAIHTQGDPTRLIW